jgi:diaminohydroxyphosphoribosylaminopyrimidine deaminase/5-amino-6-(5-phosphoribosylamino)uracil reductase
MSGLLEGGAEVHASALKAGIVDKVVIFIAPMLMTGKDSLCSIGGVSPKKLAQSIQLHDIVLRQIGKDIMVEGYVKI